MPLIIEAPLQMLQSLVSSQRFHPLPLPKAFNDLPARSQRQSAPVWGYHFPSLSANTSVTLNDVGEVWVCCRLYIDALALDSICINILVCHFDVKHLIGIFLSS